MNTYDWQKCRQALRQSAALPATPPAAAHWADFYAQVAMHPQCRPAPIIILPWWRQPRLVLVAAAMLLCAGLLAGTWLLTAPWAGGAATMTANNRGAGNPSAVESLDIVVDYQSVMIVQDDATAGGTLVWCSGLK